MPDTPSLPEPDSRVIDASGTLWQVSRQAQNPHNQATPYPLQEVRNGKTKRSGPGRVCPTTPPTNASESPKAAMDPESAMVKAIKEHGDEIGAFHPDLGTRTFFSIYVTDIHAEPVNGLQRENFAIKQLWYSHRGFGELAQGSGFESFDDMPGVYFLSQSHPALPLGNAFGVSVKKRRPASPNRGGSAIVAIEFDFGFSMVTAAESIKSL